MKKWHKYLSIVLMLVVCITLMADKVHADTTIRDYQITVNFTEAGNMESEELITYQVHDEVQSLKHRLMIGNQGDLESLNVAMKSADANDYFPFAASSSQDVGTYTLQEDGPYVNLELFNHLTKGQHEVNYQANVKGAWINYGKWQILDLSFINAPFSTRQTSISFKFPKAVDRQQMKLVIADNDRVEANWVSDQELRLTVNQLSPDKGIGIQMVLPGNFFPDNSRVGPESQGQELVRAIEENEQARLAEQRRYSYFSLALAGLIFLLSLVFVAYLIYRKSQINQGVSSYPYLAIDRSEWSPLTLAKFMGHHISKTSQFYFVLFALAGRGKLRLNFDKVGKRIQDIQVQLLDRSQLSPEEEKLTTALAVAADSSASLSLREWQYEESSKGRLKERKAFKQLKNQIDQITNKSLRQSGLFLKQSQLFNLLANLLIFLALLALLVCLYWQYQYHFSNLWVYILFVLAIITLLFAAKLVLPIRRENGVKVYKAYRSQIKALKDPDKMGDMVNSAYQLDYLYLYAWLEGKQVEFAQAIDRYGHQKAPLYQQSQAIKSFPFRKIQLSPNQTKNS
ncbi:DUF2207 family protein [Aerococcus kribbianus]|uniref:DUF2207 domain-containing protein n=1 Tax=Aerococcus kribbianus TaxID=2999064 RepID=A0A9X3FW96_9LACT|nr:MULTISPECIES: DUF2207 domain-containing protein [unclassified Aerococcus]MCZ0717389.1 DUF2207 domain-containing protein [Aerococcus sp. YH-aer221]MCZ0725677.1 DUF2207 domain-containing protein [Aerococcus sp. YH-aer222]